MADLLLELFSEEIPARMQQAALEHLQAGLHKALGVSVSEGFVTPRRLALIIRDLPEIQPDINTELKGPKTSAPEAALAGFLKKNNLTLEQLEDRGGVYFATVYEKGKPTAEILQAVIVEILEKFPWPKSMRWGSGSAIWVRPLQSILCIFDGKIVPVEFAGIKAGNITYGHRFLAPQPMIIHKVGEYEKSLDKSFVIASRDKRKSEISKQAQEIAAAHNLIVKKDDALLEEVVGLVEFPMLLLGKIDDKFMDLPPEVLTMVMRSHQKYFALQNSDGSLSSHFLITANMQAEDNGKAIIAGNERVLRARFADARFFWDTDRKKPLSEWAEGLKTVTYHAKLGTVADKVERINSLALKLSDYIKADKKLIGRACELCKADLVTGMVGEFAELQGIMGRYYAMQQKESHEVADAIRDHYKPAGAGDNLPVGEIGICIALADKIDTIVSMFAIGEKPTGSKDPFALRRAAIGIIRIILENGLRLPLKSLFLCPQIRVVALHKAHDKLVKKTEEKLNEPHKIGKYLSVSETAYEDIAEDAAEKLCLDIFSFIIDRLKVQLKDSGIRHDVIDAVTANGDDDLVRIVKFAKELQSLIASEQGKKLLLVYNRSNSIVVAEEKKDKISYNNPVNESALTAEEEKNLYKAIENIVSAVNQALKQESFGDLMEMIDRIRPYLETFFDKLMVNDSDSEIRSNRLCLLSSFCRTLNKVADFSKIEG